VGLDLSKVSIQVNSLHLDPVGIAVDDEDEQMPDFGGMFAMEIKSEEELVKAMRELGAERLEVEVNVNMGASECLDMRRNRWSLDVETKYKRKDKKVHPVNVPMPDGQNPGGDVMQEVENLDSFSTSSTHGGKKVP